MADGKGTMGVRRGSLPWQDFLTSSQAPPAPVDGSGGFQSPGINGAPTQPAPAGAAAGLAQPQPAQPGVSGITPGGLERRLVSQSPTNQISGNMPNPSSLGAGPSFNGDEIRNSQSQMPQARMQVQGSTIGPDMQQLTDPLMLIRRLMQGGM